jgi:hypothetical protein
MERGEGPVGARAALEEGVGALLKVQHGADDALPIFELEVEVPPKNIAHGGHSVAKVLQLLPGLVEHMADACFPIVSLRHSSDPCGTNLDGSP